MSTPTPERPTMDDDLEQAYAQAHALANGERGPAPSVRASVLAAAREVAAQAAMRPEAPPPLVPVAAPVSDVGRGRPWAWNLSSWRVRSGAALCAALVVGIAAVRFDAHRRADENVTVAAADQALSVQVMPAPPAADLPPPPKMMAPLPMPAPAVLAPTPPAVAAPEPAAAARAPDDEKDKDLARTRDPERAVAQADAPAPDARQARMAEIREAPRDASTKFALAPPAPTPAPTAASPVPVPAAPAATGTQVAEADTRQRVVVTGSRMDAPAASAGDTVQASSIAVRKAAPAALGSAMGAALRAPPGPLHVAANADDVDALTRLLADPATRVDAPDALGRTALQVAVAAGHVRAVRMLLAAGADPDHADATGASPRSVARSGASAEIAALLAAR